VADRSTPQALGGCFNDREQRKYEHEFTGSKDLDARAEKPPGREVIGLLWFGMSRSLRAIRHGARAPIWRCPTILMVAFAAAAVRFRGSTPAGNWTFEQLVVASGALGGFSVIHVSVWGHRPWQIERARYFLAVLWGKHCRLLRLSAQILVGNRRRRAASLGVKLHPSGSGYSRRPPTSDAWFLQRGAFSSWRGWACCVPGSLITGAPVGRPRGRQQPEDRRCAAPEAAPTLSVAEPNLKGQGQERAGDAQIDGRLRSEQRSNISFEGPLPWLLGENAGACPRR